MAISEKVREKIDDASQELKEAIDNLAREVNELTDKVKEKLKGTGEDVRENVEELKREVTALSEKAKDLIPRRRKREGVPIRAERAPEFYLDPWDQPFRELGRAADRLYEEFMRSRWPWREWPSPWRSPGYGVQLHWPHVDMTETEEAVRILAELPGVDRDDIEVSVSEDRITIRGEKKEQEEETGGDYYRLERRYGSFQRTFPLPCEVQSDRIEASFKDGLLRITLPKSAGARERIRRIPISGD